MSTTTTRKAKTSRRPRLTKEERDQRLEELKTTLNSAVQTLLDDPANWIKFLDVACNFTHYSFNNQILIWVQALERGFEPTMVLGAGDQKALREGGTPKYGWAKLGRHPKYGSSSMKIFRPQKFRYTEEQYAALDPANRPPRDAKGRPPYKGVQFYPTPVFDISQTDGKPVENVPTVMKFRQTGEMPKAQLLTGEDTTDSQALVETLIRSRGFTFHWKTPEDFVAIGYPTANGVTWGDRREVWVRTDRAPAQQLKTSIHELAHIDCGHVEDGCVAHRGRRETEAESVAYIVAGALGLDTEAYSAPYVATWAQDVKVLAEAGATINRVARKILDELLPEPTTEEIDDEEE